MNFLVNVREYGAQGNGRDLDTGAILSAFQACRAQGGGTVYFPPGRYFTSALQLVSNLCLFVDAGATLVFTQDFNAYPPVCTRWEGVVCYGFSPLVYGNGLTSICLTGCGTIDGCGEAWWER